MHRIVPAALSPEDEISSNCLGVSLDNLWTDRCRQGPSRKRPFRRPEKQHKYLHERFGLYSVKHAGLLLSNTPHGHVRFEDANKRAAELARLSKRDLA